MDKLIQPRKIQGFWELPPEKQVLFNSMKDKISKVFEENCFMPLDTPVAELEEILLAKSGGEIDKEIYTFAKGSTNMCLRYDLTVPLARFVAASYPTLEFPFKRYQIGKSYRGEKPQKGRWREFYQCDADIIGSETLPLVADAECVKLYHECFSALGYDEIIEISNRNLLLGLIEDCGNLDKSEEIIIILDKFDKIGEENVKLSLSDLGLSIDSIQKYISAVACKGTFEEIESKLVALSQNQTFLKGIQEIKELDSYLKAFGCPQDNYIFNLGIIRGHDYYTGSVFEVYLKNNRHFGSLGGGGRYDNLAGFFCDKKLPGVGISIGLSRLFDLFDQSGLLPETKKSCIEVFIIPLGDYMTDCIALCQKLRTNGVKTEVAYGENSFKSKMKEANRREIPFTLIVGENEVKEKKYAFKDMTTGNQEALTIDEIIAKF